MFTRDPVDGYEPVTLGHRDVIVGCNFRILECSGRIVRVYTINRGRAVVSWDFIPSGNEKTTAPKSDLMVDFFTGGTAFTTTTALSSQFPLLAHGLSGPTIWCGTSTSGF